MGVPNNAAEIFSGLVGAGGLTPVAACGVLGNIFAESGGDLNSVGSGGCGLLGYTPPSSAPPGGQVTANGPNPNVAQQTAAAVAYIQNSYPGGVAALNQITDPYSAGASFAQYGERCAACINYNGAGYGQLPIRGQNAVDCYNAYKAGTLGQPTQGTAPGTPGLGGDTGPVTAQTIAALIGGPILPPAPGMASSIAADQFFINDAPMDIDVSNAVIDISLTLDATQVSVLDITLHDPPPRTVINNIAFQQQSVVTIDGLMFEMVAVEKQASKVMATFEPWVVAALRSATGAVTLPPGIMTRTAFAKMLVDQVQTAVFSAAEPGYLYTLDSGYAANTKEQLSRGTINNPRENSWACLQRLASEIGWRCFELSGIVYFGPDSWLMAQPAVATLMEFTNGVQTIDGTYDIGQPLGTLTINDVSGSWAPLPGALVKIAGLGALGGKWLVVTLERKSIFHPDVTITCQQPQPSLPEPSSGGSQAAVSPGFGQPGNQQSTTGSAAAQQALKYAINQLGVPYQWGGENPQTGFDCSGLMQAAYAAAGVPISRSTYTQLPEFNLLPAGIGNLRAGDLVFFGTPGNPTHVGMFVSVESGDTAKMINAPNAGSVVRYDDFTPDTGANWGGDQYLGANRPAP